MIYLQLYSFLHTVYFGTSTSLMMFFSCISISSLSYFQTFFSKRKLAGENFVKYQIETN